MISVFQGETGGYVAFTTAPLNATSGYVDVAISRTEAYRFDGFVASGSVFVPKASLSSLAAGVYTCLPQTVDENLRTYYLTVTDLEIIGVPDFFSDAVLTSGNSVLVRLEALEEAVEDLDTAADKTYRHVQQMPEEVIVVEHGLDKYPSVLILDTAGDQCFGYIQYDTVNQVTLTFGSPFSGVVMFN